MIPGMIDLHSHVLPGIDDGADSLDEAVEMCRLAAQDGCTGIVATPHVRHGRWWNGERQGLEKLHAELRQRLGGAPELYLGSEIAVHSDSVEEIYLLPQGELVTLAGSRYLLLELDWHGLGPNVLDVIYELKIKGLFPIIAHPERVRWLAAEPPLIEEMVTRGAYLQVTAMSLTGDLGPEIKALSKDLLQADLLHFVASDMHDTRIRRPGLGLAYRQVVADFGRDTAERIFLRNPRAVVDDQPLDST